MHAIAEKNGTALKTKVRPIGDQILVRQVQAQAVTKGGIHLPDMVQEKERPLEGVVLAVGKGARSLMTGERIEPEVKVGDRVIFARYAGADAKIDEEELHLLSEKDVLAVLA